MYREKTRLLQNLIITAFAASICFIPAISLAQSEVAPDSSYADSAYSGARVVNQPAGDKSDQKGPSRGDYALQFRIGSDFTLHSFSGALISFQRTLSDRNAIRWGLSLDGGYNKVKTDRNEKSHEVKFNIGVSMNYLWYTPIAHEIRFYCGAGPIVLFGYNQTKTLHNSGLNIRKETITSGEIGVIGVAGVEWFVRPHISLLAEYVPELIAKYQNTVNKNTDTTVIIHNNERQEFPHTTKSKASTKDIHLGSASVRFGVSVYF